MSAGSEDPPDPRVAGGESRAPVPWSTRAGRPSGRRRLWRRPPVGPPPPRPPPRRLGRGLVRPRPWPAGRSPRTAGPPAVARCCWPARGRRPAAAWSDWSWACCCRSAAWWAWRVAWAVWSWSTAVVMFPTAMAEYSLAAWAVSWLPAEQRCLGTRRRSRSSCRSGSPAVGRHRILALICCWSWCDLLVGLGDGLGVGGHPRRDHRVLLLVGAHLELLLDQLLGDGGRPRLQVRDLVGPGGSAGRRPPQRRPGRREPREQRRGEGPPTVHSCAGPASGETPGVKHNGLRT